MTGLRAAPVKLSPASPRGRRGGGGRGQLRVTTLTVGREGGLSVPRGGGGGCQRRTAPS